LFVRIPWHNGEKLMQPTPSSSKVSINPSSIQRSNML